MYKMFDKLREVFLRGVWLYLMDVFLCLEKADIRQESTKHQNPFLPLHAKETAIKVQSGSFEMLLIVLPLNPAEWD